MKGDLTVKETYLVREFINGELPNKDFEALDENQVVELLQQHRDAFEEHCYDNNKDLLQEEDSAYYVDHIIRQLQIVA